jgi:hypothetical protein
MSLLFPRNSNNNYEAPFNKDAIIETIKEQLPEPWIWYTINTAMNPSCEYDLLIIRNKDIKEHIHHARQFSSFTDEIDCTYSIVLGIYVVDKFSSQKRFTTSTEESLVTATVEVNSARTLFDLIKEVDTKRGVIKNV